MLIGNRRNYLILTIAVILASCTTDGQYPAGTPSNLTPTVQPPLSSQVQLTPIYFREEGTFPKYIIDGAKPRLTGSDDQRVQDFNRLLDELVESEIQFFRENVLSLAPQMPVSSGSLFNVQYQNESFNTPIQGIWSLRLNFVVYADGGLRNNTYSRTLNYDLEHGDKLDLADLFLSDGDYLEIISNYCIYELTRRGVGFYGGHQSGAKPSDDNYRNWIALQDNILFIFDSGQVAALDLDKQEIHIPYAELKSIINPQGPLGALVH